MGGEMVCPRCGAKTGDPGLCVDCWDADVDADSDIPKRYNKNVISERTSTFVDPGCWSRWARNVVCVNKPQYLAIYITGQRKRICLEHLWAEAKAIERYAFLDADAPLVLVGKALMRQSESAQ